MNSRDSEDNMRYFGSWVQMVLVFISLGMAASASILAYSATTRIGKLNCNVAIFYVPLMLLGMYFVPMVPNIIEENFLTGFFVSLGSLLAAVYFPFVIIFCAIEFLGGRNPDKVSD